MLAINQSGKRVLSKGLVSAKPVIRFPHGNRLLILFNGLKFDNQQWQEEHGLGIPLKRQLNCFPIVF